MLTRGQRITGYVRHRCVKLNVFKHHIPVTTIATSTKCSSTIAATITTIATTSTQQVDCW